MIVIINKETQTIVEAYLLILSILAMFATLFSDIAAKLESNMPQDENKSEESGLTQEVSCNIKEEALNESKNDG